MRKRVNVCEDYHVSFWDAFNQHIFNRCVRKRTTFRVWYVCIFLHHYCIYMDIGNFKNYLRIKVCGASAEYHALEISPEPHVTFPCLFQRGGVRPLVSGGSVSQKEGGARPPDSA